MPFNRQHITVVEQRRSLKRKDSVWFDEMSDKTSVCRHATSSLSRCYGKLNLSDINTA
jgi:hypothetical protein